MIAAGDAPGDTFVDALLGVRCIFEKLAPVLDGGARGEGDAGGGDDLLDAVLGLVSLRTTIDLVLAALAGEGGAASPPTGDAAAWSRELLR